MKFIIFLSVVVTTYGGVVIPEEEELSKQAKRIVGGSDTTIGKHPWQISLQRGTGSSWSHSCGGSIIDEKWVVTAAHCVEGSSTSSLRVAAGSTIWSEDVQTRNLKDFTMHPDYDGSASGYPNDIAVIELESPLELNENVDKVDMADEDGDFAGVECVISGWGQTGSGSIPETLQDVSMTVLSNSDCSTIWTGSINDGHICIGSDTDISDGRSACFGDSGGPMICQSKLAGATSWGSGSCSGKPTVYTRVSQFRKWIRDQTGI
ncbi:Trypsin beta,Trypsin delta,Chymotrypsin-like serine proteinase,Trypsin alpha,Chymotrypsin A,Trypsin delta/gamma-like protein CG30031,Chymotrypsin B [Mytilus edulis]|uniref:Trypsin beta,Trypsin delta,Chymotrypsin-like serine proteinase,Trypsin alpha,Chymotrypsin A,Trypsin delta/gamma-like protein CG30031,Chymotrypsin B n=1 Tax=Mytilus edulis TaxID=6550 RepID=A0A8S3T1V3_MYTED|nr:Trypsin beta,Trypsin delta,Chymotrypsin-like serine proteinase,Trypsin alpha,Chymotrypsin A,Trypsin delta/gamma-like protein CG30031,Chymotrypsin B [Mytilus edulis]